MMKSLFFMVKSTIWFSEKDPIRRIPFFVAVHYGSILWVKKNPFRQEEFESRHHQTSRGEDES
jgi:hypothetical protein